MARLVRLRQQASEPFHFSIVKNGRENDMSKTKESIVRVKVNPAERNGTSRDEVAIQSPNHEDDPYINRVIYAKPGVFKDGDLALSEVEKLEAKSWKVLNDELSAILEKEAKEREAAQKAEAAKTEKKEG